MITPRQIIRGVAYGGRSNWKLAASGAHSLQQPRRARQLGRRRPRNDARPSKDAAWPPHAHPVPQLRRRRRRTRTRFQLQVAPLADYVNAHQNITVDVGQVLFGKTTSMTGDGPLGLLPVEASTAAKWFSAATPRWRPAAASRRSSTRTRSLVHAWQWAIGLEWYLLVDDSVAGCHEHRPSQRRLVPRLSADHPAADGPALYRPDVLKITILCVQVCYFL